MASEMTDEARQRAAQLADQLFEQPVTPRAVQLLEQFDAAAYRRGLEAVKEYCLDTAGRPWINDKIDGYDQALYDIAKWVENRLAQEARG